MDRLHYFEKRSISFENDEAFFISLKLKLIVFVLIHYQKFLLRTIVFKKRLSSKTIF